MYHTDIYGLIKRFESLNLCGSRYLVSVIVLPTPNISWVAYQALILRVSFAKMNPHI